MRILSFITLFVLVLSVIGCSSGPEPIYYGRDVCSHCKMVISDAKYGAELVTGKGKIYKFDSAECMIDFLNEDQKKLDDPDALFLVTNLAAPGELMDAETAFFLHDKEYQSPMGGNLAAFKTRMMADNNQQSADAEIFTWEEVLVSR